MNLYAQALAEPAQARVATLVLCLLMLGGVAVTFGLLRLVYLQEQRRQRAKDEEAQTGPAPEDDAGEG